MVLLGIMWIAWAWALLLEPRENLYGADAAVLYEFLPPWLRATLWGGTGAFAILVAHNIRGQRWGLAGLAFMPFERAVSFLWAFLMWLTPGHPPGLASEALAAGSGWAALTGIIMVLAQWVEDVPTDSILIAQNRQQQQLERRGGALDSGSP